MLEVLKQKFGFDGFRPGQQEAIETLLESGRLLCIQPTGHGKSLLYQLPACLLPGITVVISPLLALMRDQVQQLNERFDIAAASINSDQDEQENVQMQQRAQRGDLKVLFVAPEKLDNLNYFEFLIKLPISLIVIDEAHCISTWGHDFRPSYRQIIQFVKTMSAQETTIKVLGLTATANDKTADDIKRQLSVDTEITVLRHSMNRANIQLQVLQAHNIESKLYLLKESIEQLDGVGLIYCATRENTVLVSDYLQHHNINATAYHAGFSGDEKKLLQQQFLSNKYKVIAATNALGMGIDKQDLRFIIHFDVPGSITAYYQEVGRCGRDGNLATGILLFDKQDKKIQQHFINSAQPTEDDFENVLAILKQPDALEGLNLQAIKVRSGLHPTRTLIVVTELMEQGFAQKKLIGRKQVYQIILKPNKPDLGRYKTQLQVRQHELRSMLQYGDETKRCLMAILRSALGDKEVERCGHCSNCRKLRFPSLNISQLDEIESWVAKREVQIAAVKTNNIAKGVAVLNGQLRSPMFIDFMKKRAEDENYSNEMLFGLIRESLDSLKANYKIGCVMVLPSRTWKGRKAMAKFIGNYLQKPFLLESLQWKDEPESRQGELLNNDQRKHNVSLHMTIDKSKIIPEGDILLLDDYIGSGVTIKEAARVLRKQAMITSEIIPFSIASVKWRLGARGMV